MMLSPTTLGPSRLSVIVTAISIIVLLVMSYLVFVKGLELQFPLWPKFMSN